MRGAHVTRVVGGACPGRAGGSDREGGPGRASRTPRSPPRPAPPPARLGPRSGPSPGKRCARPPGDFAPVVAAPLHAAWPRTSPPTLPLVHTRQSLVLKFLARFHRTLHIHKPLLHKHTPSCLHPQRRPPAHTDLYCAVFPHLSITSPLPEC